MYRYHVIFIVLFILLYILRYSENIRLQENIFYGGIQYHLADLPDRTSSNYIMHWKGNQILCKVEKEECKSLERAQIGDLVYILSRPPEEAINDEYAQKEPMYASKVVVHPVEPLPGLSPWWYMRNIVAFKHRVVHIYKTLYAEPHASLIAGITIGEKSSFSKEFYQRLVETGTLHIVAASGFNVTILAAMLIAILLRLFSRKIAIVVAAIGVGGYVVLAGLSSAVIRAGIMALLALGAQATGKKYLAEFGLLFSSSLMLILSPWLLSSVSFQLSVAATAGLLWGTKPVTKVLEKLVVYKQFSLWKLPILGPILLVDLSTTIAASLATYPLTILHFGQFSWISPLVNMVVLWAVPPLTVLGILLLLMGFLWLPLARLFSWLAWPLLEYFVRAIEFFAVHFTGAFEGISFNWWFVAAWWLCLYTWWSSFSSGGEVDHEAD